MLQPSPRLASALYASFPHCPFSIAMTVISSGVYFGEVWALKTANSASFANFLFAMHFLPVVTAIGCMFVVMWADPNPRNASRGAMDNATGLCSQLCRYKKCFMIIPEKMPKNCRIIDFNCGSEEAGLRGSIAFTREHKGEPILENTWNINIDSVADKDFFEVVIKDDWQFCRFDTDLQKMFKDTFNELGIVSKTNGCIHNPVGGCDSTPMTKAGMKSVTFAASGPHSSPIIIIPGTMCPNVLSSKPSVTALMLFSELSIK